MDFKIKVMMFGGRRAGKTSVLAAMCNEFDGMFGDSNLTISTVGDTMRTLEEKSYEMQQYYHDVRKAGSFTPDDSPTEDISQYTVHISFKNKPTSVLNLVFVDYPGELLASEKDESIKKIMDESDIILIAVDTPYLMEESGDDIGGGVGKYCEKKNYCSRISNYVKNYFQPDINPKSRVKSKKTIMLIPLKCEKYYNEGRMGEVSAKIKLAYKSLITHVTSSALSDYYEVVIAPIMTMGTVAFRRFGRDENNETIMAVDDKGKPMYPSAPLYRFCGEHADGIKPMYCEQPLVYALMHLLQSAEEIKRSKESFSFIFANQKIRDLVGGFFKLPFAADYMNERKNLRKKLKTSGDGYEILSDPFNFRSEG